MLAGVALEKALSSFDKIYHYKIPSDITVSAGMRVTVPFGKGNTEKTALVLEILSEREYSGELSKLKSITSKIDDQPILDEEGIFLVEALKEMTFCSYFDAFRSIVPPGIGMKRLEGVMLSADIPSEGLELSERAEELYKKLKSKKTMLEKEKILDQQALEELIAKGVAELTQQLKRKIGDKRAVMARLIDTEQDYKLTPKQQDVVEFLMGVERASVKEICYFCGVGQGVVENLAKKGRLELYEEIVYREIEKTELKITETKLSDHQASVLSKIEGFLEDKKKTTTLLYGVTGSGKTQVFIKLIEKTLKRGKSVIILVPEIGLTPQTVAEFTGRFGDRVALLHSALSMGERLDQWRKIKEGNADVVVGTRMAVFAPVKNVGLIVIDEEQERTYKSESTPRYSAIKVAIARAKRAGAGVLLCSATPSIESFYKATNGIYNFAELTERFSKNGLPPVVTIDMNHAEKVEGSSIISDELAFEIKRRLDKKEQTILLLNRRGYHTMVKCSGCQSVAKCPHCSVALTYHRANDSLVCHYCGFTKTAASKCDLCQKPLSSSIGIGTQRVEQEVRALYPSAKVLRMDMDTTMTKYSHQRQFESFSKGEYDIMIGTQMVAKGLNFPKVTLVGVLAADQSLYNEDFRAYERTFSLLTQVVGRCGRSELAGIAYVQTYTPDNEVISLSAKQNYKAYYSMELPFREIGLYPPYCDIFEIAFYHEDEFIVEESAVKFSEIFRRLAKDKYQNLPIRLLGPAQASIYKQADRYKLQFMLKCRDNRQTRELIRETLNLYNKDKNLALCSVDTNG